MNHSIEVVFCILRTMSVVDSSEAGDALFSISRLHKATSCFAVVKIAGIIFEKSSHLDVKTVLQADLDFCDVLTFCHSTHRITSDVSCYRDLSLPTAVNQTGH